MKKDSISSKEIIKGNELIAEFMGCKYDEDFFSWKMKYMQHEPMETPLNMQYYSSWDWIMPVIDKIKELKYPVYIYQSHVQNTVQIFQLGQDHYIIRESGTIEKPVEITWKAVVEFIKYYNKNVKDKK